MEKRLKKGFTASLLSILMIGLASAQFYSGYSRFSPRSSLLDIFDAETVFYGGTFIIIFGFTFYALSKFLKKPTGEANTGIAGSIAFAISAMSVYGLYWSRFDISNYLPSSGFFYNIPSSIIPLAFLIALIFMIWKFGISNSMIVLGLFLMAITFTDFVYEKGAIGLIGLLALITGMIIRSRGAGAVIGGINQRRPSWKYILAGILIAVGGFIYFGWIASIVGIILIAIGISAGKKAYSKASEYGENIKRGRVMFKGRAEDEARAEHAKRKDAARRAQIGRAQIEAREMQRQMGEIEREITAIARRISRRMEDLGRAVGPARRQIQNEINTLESQKRDLIDRLDRLRRG